MESPNNIPNSILEKIDRKLHNQKNHPIEIIKKHIYNYFSTKYNVKIFDDLSPFVSTYDNFDSLLILPNHPARSKTDTYYFDENTVLRTHTSAHQAHFLSQGIGNFLITGDVYRKDEINKTHYPIFHQMEGVLKISSGDPIEEIKNIICGLIEYLFPGCSFTMRSDYFPFTEPSFEVDVMMGDKELEVLGCGIVHQDILKACSLDPEEKYLAFGLGLERLAMIMFEIPDIRYFWSEDPKFIDQFSTGAIKKFTPYSSIPPKSEVISFWVPNQDIINEKWIKENDFFEITRNLCDKLIESVTIEDTFENKKTKKYSLAYKIVYSPSNPSAKNAAEFRKECIALQNELRNQVVEKIGVELR